MQKVFVNVPAEAKAKSSDGSLACVMCCCLPEELAQPVLKAVAMLGFRHRSAPQMKQLSTFLEIRMDGAVTELAAVTTIIENVVTDASEQQVLEYAATRDIKVNNKYKSMLDAASARMISGELMDDGDAAQVAADVQGYEASTIAAMQFVSPFEGQRQRKRKGCAEEGDGANRPSHPPRSAQVRTVACRPEHGN